ncbi:hypothetical protein BC826DRAFT_523560 [Russula brevipes]|nr:hypothetical protein BC826DRAFT_523560 [Russula brevipes]
MSHCLSTAICLPSIKCSNPIPLSHESRRSSNSANSPHGTSTSIHILDDDSLLNIFYLYRRIPTPVNANVTTAGNALLGEEWDRECWWFKLVHVCRRWRYLILVADMLAHSPPLPLVINFSSNDRSVSAEDEEGIILALQHCDRMRCIRLEKPVPSLQKVIMAIDGEFPTLEYLSIWHRFGDRETLMLLQTFRAPHLRHLMLVDFAIQLGSPLLMPATGLVTLWLEEIPPSAYFGPNDLLQQLSLMPQLETLAIGFRLPVPDRDIEGQLLQRSMMADIVTLPNLRWYWFRGTGAWLEEFILRMAAPLLERFEIFFFARLTYFFIPHLEQFLNTRGNFKFSCADITFYQWQVSVTAHPHGTTRAHPLCLQVGSRYLDIQLSSAVQILSQLRTVLSTVEHLTIRYERYPVVPECHHEASRLLWRGLLRSFNHVKELVVCKGLVSQLSRSLRVDCGESPMEMLPELKELAYDVNGDTGDAFTVFINARQDAGHPVVLVHR